MIKQALLILLLLAGLHIFPANICGYDIEGTVYTFINGKKLSFKVGLADTPKEYQNGLKDCMLLPDGTGLLFLFNNYAPRHFWMDNTHIPLAIIYIDKNFKIISIHKGIPGSKTLIPSKKPVKYVLEVNYSEAKSLKQGMELKLLLY